MTIKKVQLNIIYHSMISKSPLIGPYWKGRCSCLMSIPCTIWILWCIRIIMDLIILFKKTHHKGHSRTESSCFLVREIRLEGIVSPLPSSCPRIGSLAMSRSFRIGSCPRSAESCQKLVRFIKEIEPLLEVQGGASTLFSLFCPLGVRGNPVFNTEVKRTIQVRWV